MMLRKFKKSASIVFCVFIIIVILAVMAPTLTVFAAPSISISPSSGVSGTTVTVSGSSFSSYIGDRLSIYFDDTEVTPNGVTVSGGSIFQTTFVIPDYTVSGSHVISIKGKTGAVLAENQFYVSQPEIVLDRWSGTVGTTIKASCRGFHAGKEVSVQYYSTDVPDELASQTANDIGECTMQFTIPVSATGSHEILAKNEIGDYAQTDVEIIPSLSINPAVAAVGDKVDISGSGFTGNSEVDVTLYGNKVAFAPVSDRGAFSATFFVPALRAGTYSIAIEDSSRDIRWIDFTVETKITMSKQTGEVGLKLKVDGTGFEVGGIVTIKYDDEEMAVVLADINGTFAAYFNVPVSVAGPHNVTITDGFNTKQAVFTVESDPPPVPEIFVPKLDSVIDAKVFFDWENVYDPSQPVVYTLQVARTADFQQPILEKEGLSDSQYTLSEEEALRPSRRFTYYYWRVRATDSASNTGDWSLPVAFRVEPSNTLPVWAEITLIGIGVLLVIILGSCIRKGTKALKAEKKT
jgi:hypothetical protein